MRKDIKHRVTVDNLLPSNAYYVRNVNTYGNIITCNARDENGVAPIVRIARNKVDSVGIEINAITQGTVILT